MKELKITFSLEKIDILKNYLNLKGFKQIDYKTDYIDTAIWKYQSITNNTLLLIHANDFANEVIVTGDNKDLLNDIEHHVILDIQAKL